MNIPFIREKHSSFLFLTLCTWHLISHFGSKARKEPREPWKREHKNINIQIKSFLLKNTITTTSIKLIGDHQTTMYLIFTLRIVMCLGMATAFHPSSILRITKPTTALQSSAFFDLDPVSKLNLDKVHYCADNFGKCSIKEMEDMKKALHTERLQHSAVGVPLDPVE